MTIILQLLQQLKAGYQVNRGPILELCANFIVRRSIFFDGGPSTQKGRLHK